VTLDLWIVLATITGAQLKSDFSPNSEEWNKVCEFFLGRNGQSRDRVGDRPDRLLIRDLMIVQYPMLGTVMKPTVTAQAQVTKWLDTQVTIFGARMTFARPNV
jgi:hypothetical protein